MIAITVETTEEKLRIISEEYRKRFFDSEILSDSFLWIISTMTVNGKNSEFAELCQLARIDARPFAKMVEYTSALNYALFHLKNPGDYTDEEIEKVAKKREKKCRQKISHVLGITSKLIETIRQNNILERIIYNPKTPWLEAYFKETNAYSLKADLQKIIDFLIIAENEGIEYTYFFIN